jgi:hypothetical protein
MDDSVQRAMAKWPDVPAVHDWLRLDATGRWRVGGEPVLHHGLIAFIGRNYDCDEHGRWFFQNGPQRVYVTLAYTPWVLHVDSGGRLRTHTGQIIASVRQACVDEDGELLLATEVGPGVVDADSLPTASEWLVDAHGEPIDADTLAAALNGADTDIRFTYAGAGAALMPIARSAVAERFGFVSAPQPAA